MKVAMRENDFQLYIMVKNKLIFNEMMIRYAL